MATANQIADRVLVKLGWNNPFAGPKVTGPARIPEKTPSSMEETYKGVDARRQQNYTTAEKAQKNQQASSGSIAKPPPKDTDSSWDVGKQQIQRGLAPRVSLYNQH